MCLLTALIIAGGGTNAAATPLSPFRYEKRYARGNTGSFVCRDEARSNGYRRSLLGLR